MTSLNPSTTRQPSDPVQYFLDRSLGKTTAARLREAGWKIITLAEVYPDDAQHIADETWIAEGIQRGWSLLTKDQRIRWRTQERQAIGDGVMFKLSSGNLTIAEAVRYFHANKDKIDRYARRGGPAIHVVYADDVKQQWPLHQLRG